MMQPTTPHGWYSMTDVLVQPMSGPQFRDSLCRCCSPQATSHLIFSHTVITSPIIASRLVLPLSRAAIVAMRSALSSTSWSSTRMTRRRSPKETRAHSCCAALARAILLFTSASENTLTSPSIFNVDGSWHMRRPLLLPPSSEGLRTRPSRSDGHSKVS